MDSEVLVKENDVQGLEKAQEGAKQLWEQQDAQEEQRDETECESVESASV